MKRKICIITGTRADYGILSSVMQSIKDSSDLQLFTIVTGMHLMREFGYTVKEIEKDGFSIYEKINISYSKDTGEAMANSVGRAVALFARSLRKLKPDILVILGDRGEMLAAAIAANYLNIPVAHIHGGEVSGHVDGLLRHAITKLSHIHFAASQDATNRILKLGERADMIFTSGAPALDKILNQLLPSDNDLRKKYCLKTKEQFVLLVQHPVSSQSGEADQQIKATLDALVALKIRTIIIYPNADAGGRKMIEIIKKYENKSFFSAYKSISHKDYLGLMKIASVLIGNSSSGIIEAPSLKLPVVNIGIRQEGREQSTNIINVQHNKNQIVVAIKKALFNRRFIVRVKKCKNPYGKGKASRFISKVLGTIKLDSNLLQKQITF